MLWTRGRDVHGVAQRGRELPEDARTPRRPSRASPSLASARPCEVERPRLPHLVARTGEEPARLAQVGGALLEAGEQVSRDLGAAHQHPCRAARRRARPQRGRGAAALRGVRRRWPASPPSVASTSGHRSASPERRASRRAVRSSASAPSACPRSRSTMPDHLVPDRGDVRGRGRGPARPRAVARAASGSAKSVRSSSSASARSTAPSLRIRADHLCGFHSAERRRGASVASMGDWMIGNDRRRRTHRPAARPPRGQRRTGRVGHRGTGRLHLRLPSRPRAGAVPRTSTTFEARGARLDKGVLAEPPRRDDVRLLDGELVRYVLAERPGGESVPDVLDLLEAERAAPAARPRPTTGSTSPPAAAAAARCARPSSRRRPASPSRGRPGRPQQKKSCDVSVVVVDTGWNPPSGTDPRTPWLDGRHRRRRGQRPRPAALRRARHVHRRRRALRGPGDRRLRRGLRDRRASVAAASWSPTSSQQLEEALTHDPQVINLSAGCRTRLDRPSIALREVPPHGTSRKRDCVLVAAAGNDSWAAPFWPAAFDWCVGVGLARPRRTRVGLLQLRRLRRRLRARPQPRQRVPRRDLRVPREPGQGRRTGVQHRAGPVERYVVRGAGRGRADRPPDLRDRLVGARRRATPSWPARRTTPTRWSARTSSCASPTRTTPDRAAVRRRASRWWRPCARRGR